MTDPARALLQKIVESYNERTHNRTYHLIVDAMTLLATPAAPARQPALERFNEFVLDEDGPLSPVERLRAFCSFAMSGQDWIDVEPFFDALTAAPAAPAEPVTGWRMVPVEPTPEILKAAMDTAERHLQGDWFNDECKTDEERANKSNADYWRAMLDAAPPPPRASEQEDAQPVARVRIHRTGGNVGMAWSAVPVDDAPMMREGDLLYAAPPARANAVDARWFVCVGAKVYGNHPDKDRAMERAKMWAEKYPETPVWVEKRTQVWSNGVRFDISAALRAAPGDKG